jgi:hypothetical protein
MPEARVKSLPAAAYAIAKGAKLLRCEPSQPGRVDFILEDPLSTVSTTARDFFTGGEVSARDCYRALQDVRLSVNRILDGKGGAR